MCVDTVHKGDKDDDDDDDDDNNNNNNTTAATLNLLYSVKNVHRKTG
jgi:hypothetical protein